MKTSIEVRDLIFAAIKTTTLPGAVSGKVLTTKRPADSNKEDIRIVVSSNSTRDYGQLQDFIVYVLVYVPDKMFGGQYEENVQRVRTLSKACVDSLSGIKLGNCKYELAEQSVIEREDERTHVISNRLMITINIE